MSEVFLFPADCAEREFSGRYRQCFFYVVHRPGSRGDLGEIFFFRAMNDILSAPAVLSSRRDLVGC